MENVSPVAPGCADRRVGIQHLDFSTFSGEGGSASLRSPQQSEQQLAFRPLSACVWAVVQS